MKFRIINGKRAINEMVSYVMLIVIVIGLAIGVYAFLKVFIGEEAEVECSENTNLIIEEAACLNKNLTVVISNRGLFNVSAFFLRMGFSGTTVPKQLNQGSEKIRPPLSPNKRTSYRYSVPQSILDSSDRYVVEVQTATLSGGRAIPCKEEVDKVEIVCNEGLESICDNGALENGEECEFKQDGSLTFRDPRFGNGVDMCGIYDPVGFRGGDLNCSGQTCRISPAGCSPSGNICGDGSITGNEVCDVGNLNSFNDDNLSGKSCTDPSMGNFVSGNLTCLPSCLGFNTSLCISSICPLEQVDNGDGTCTAILGSGYIIEDGHVGTDPGDTTIKRENSSIYIRVQKRLTDPYELRGYIEWNISSIPSLAANQIINISFKYSGGTGLDGQQQQIYSLNDTRPSTSSNANLFSAIANGRGYYTDNPGVFISGPSPQTLSLFTPYTPAYTQIIPEDLHGQLSNDWFAIGLISLNGVNPAGTAISSSEAGEQTEPTLIVTYTLPSTGICGNSVLDSGEQCDDGNTINRDGCSSTCTNENGENVILLRDCQMLNRSNTVYLLQNDISEINENCFMIRYANNLTLDGQGHTIIGQGTSGVHGIYLYGGSPLISNIKISNIKIKNFTWSILVYSSLNSVIENTLIESNVSVRSGIYLEQTKNITLKNNTIKNFYGSGISFLESDNNKILNNAITNVVIGMSIEDSENNTVNDNFICAREDVGERFWELYCSGIGAATNTGSGNVYTTNIGCPNVKNISSCPSSSICGNSIKEPGEQCDGSDFGLGGTENRCSVYSPSLYDGGILACQNCIINTTQCDPVGITYVTGCLQDINREFEKYILKNDLVASSSCLIISANNIILDGQGHSIIGAQRGFSDVGISVGSFNNITIKNISRITSFGTGISLSGSTNVTLSYLTIYSNSVMNCGLNPHAGGIDIINSQNIILSWNNITNNCQAGIYTTINDVVLNNNYVCYNAGANFLCPWNSPKTLLGSNNFGSTSGWPYGCNLNSLVNTQPC